jgi:hypothetical protein
MWKILIKWFMEKAWPVILKLLVKYSKELLEFIFIKIFDFIKSWVEGLGKEKEEKAYQSYKKAQATADPEEKKKYMHEAEFYKKEAESYSKKLEDLEIKFEALKKQMEQEVATKTQNLKAEDLFETNSKSSMDTLLLKQNNNILMLEENPKKQ